MLTRLAQLWNLPGLQDRVDVKYSPRLSRQLGSCNAIRRSIRLNAMLKARPKLEAETLCHEAAHIAVFEVYGKSCRPHGLEWKHFIEIAGYEPKVTLTETGKIPHPVRASHLNSYEHRCTVCQFVRSASRPISRWVCADCASLGLEGRLLITRRIRKGVATE